MQLVFIHCKILVYKVDSSLCKSCCACKSYRLLSHESDAECFPSELIFTSGDMHILLLMQNINTIFLLLMPILDTLGFFQ